MFDREREAYEFGGEAELEAGLDALCELLPRKASVAVGVHALEGLLERLELRAQRRVDLRLRLPWELLSGFTSEWPLAHFDPVVYSC